MRCPECGHIQRYKLGMRCQECGYGFVLNPKHNRLVGRPISDRGMLAIIRRANANGTQRFTLNQLFVAANAHMERQLGKGRFASIVASFLLGLVSLFFLIAPPASADATGIVVVATGLSGLLIASALLRRCHGRVKRRAWDKVLTAWRKKRPKLPGLIEEPSLHTPPPRMPETDIYEYGIQRLLICQHDLQVDLLVRNGFHAEVACLVIAESGYPDYLLARADMILREQPDLPIFLWHDATAKGEGLEKRIRSGSWAAGLTTGDHPIHALGPFRAQVKQSRRLRRLAKINRGHLPADAFLHRSLFATLSTAMANVHGNAWQQSAEKAGKAGNAGSGESGWTYSETTDVDWDADPGDGDGDGE